MYVLTPLNDLIEILNEIFHNYSIISLILDTRNFFVELSDQFKFDCCLAMEAKLRNNFNLKPEV
jgi:hypothetical protein